jgi:oxalate decarboxylase/phosphoglucose isomerase-like protein (cupin superfamily)
MDSRKTTVFDCNLLQFPRIESENGNLTAVENFIEIPFSIKRIYYLYDIPAGSERGAHAHIKLQQIIIAASGSFDLILNDGKVSRTIHLNRPFMGVYLKPGIWRTLSNFSSASVCLTLASESYNENDYIRDYSAFEQFKASGLLS